MHCVRLERSTLYVFIYRLLGTTQKLCYRVMYKVYQKVRRSTENVCYASIFAIEITNLTSRIFSSKVNTIMQHWLKDFEVGNLIFYRPISTTETSKGLYLLPYSKLYCV